MNQNVNILLHEKDICGEAPLWDSRSQRLLWVDAAGTHFRSFDDRSGKTAAYRTKGHPQALGFRANGGWICPMHDRIMLLNAKFESERDMGSPIAPGDPFMINDGTVGPDGCYYFGVYHTEDWHSKEGCVYRLNPDGTFEKVISGIALPNGMAFSASGKEFYLAETFGNSVHRYRFDKRSGDFSEKERFITIPEEKGYPDGVVIDADGAVWVGHWQGFRISRFTPEGSMEREVHLKVPSATSMCLTPEGDLYITSAIKGCSDEQLRQYPDAGKLFIVKTDYSGLKEFSLKF